MKKKISASLFVLLFANGAHAEIFICKDANGRTLTSDRPIPECNNRTQRVLGENGTTKREIAPPLTAEQKKQAEEENAKKRAAVLAAEEQKRQDRALRARFKTEADIDTARKRDLELVQDQSKRPVGLQIIGNYFNEAKLLNVAHQYQQATNWHRRQPEGI